jgi:hypothetical protein
MRLTRAVTHIRLCSINGAQAAALDALAAEYMAQCHQYVTLFCSEAEPNGYADPRFPSLLSQRWQRVAIQQAARIAKSWRTNRQRAQEDFAEILVAWQEEEHHSDEREPVWREWLTPVLRKLVIQANANDALCPGGKSASFAYWRRVSTLEARQPLFLPIQASAYHERCLTGKRLDSSVTLIRKPDGWWLTLTYEVEVPPQTPLDAPVVGVDMGITHFLTTSTGDHYGSFPGKLAKRHQRDQEKCQRKAKVRASLKRKGVEQLPFTDNTKLARAVRQEINRAVNELYREHAGCQIAIERLNGATMRLKARRLNAALYASNLAHIPKQLASGAARRGVRAAPVSSGYTSQACPQCHVVAENNRPEQQTFCCGVCGWQAHADHNAAINIARRLEDQDVRACRSRHGLRALLDARHCWFNGRRSMGGMA